MTRDEAIAIWCTVHNSNHKNVAGQAIDSYAALGMLKLDEPKSARSLAIDALFQKFGGHDVGVIFDLLNEAGLKIVEAKP